MCTVLATPELTKLCPSNSPSALVFPGQGDNSRTQYWDGGWDGEGGTLETCHKPMLWLSAEPSLTSQGQSKSEEGV